MVTLPSQCIIKNLLLYSNPRVSVATVLTGHPKDQGNRGSQRQWENGQQEGQAYHLSRSQATIPGNGEKINVGTYFLQACSPYEPLHVKRTGIQRQPAL